MVECICTGLKTTVRIRGVGSRENFDYALKCFKELFPVARWRAEDKVWETWTNLAAVREYIRRLEAKGIGVLFREPWGESLVPVDVPRTGIWKQPLYEFQVVGARFLATRKRAILADEMGLGKTVQALAAVDAGRLYPFLVICPAFLIEKWKAEALDWFGATPAVIADPEDCNGKADCYLLSVSKLQKNKRDLKELFNAICSLGIKAVVVDEAHYLKNRDSKRSKRAKELIDLLTDAAGGTLNVYLLTGTPLVNRDPRELFRLLEMLYSDASHRDFERDFCVFDELRVNGRRIRVIAGAKNHEVLRGLVNSFMLRRLAKDVASQLPSLIRETVVVSLSKSAVLRDHEERIREILAKHNWRLSEDVLKLTDMLKWRQTVGAHKIPAVVDAIAGILEEERACVAFFEFTENLERAKEVLEKKLKVKVFVITGAVPPRSRPAILRRFRREGGVLFATIRSIGVGVDLDFVSAGVFAEFPYSPAEIAQAEKRLHRMTTTRPPVIKYLLADGLETFVFRNIATKCSLFERSVGAFSSGSVVQDVKEKFVEVDNAVR